jgi:hypothetical protein
MSSKSKDRRVKEPTEREDETADTVSAAFIVFLIGLAIIIILPWWIRFSRDLEYFGVEWLLFNYESFKGKGVFITVMDMFNYAPSESLWIPRTRVIAFFLLFIGMVAFVLYLVTDKKKYNFSFGLSSLLATFITMSEIFFFFSITDRIVFIPVEQLIFFVVGILSTLDPIWPSKKEKEPINIRRPELLLIVILFILAVATRETLLGIALPSALVYGIYKTRNSPALIRRRINRIIKKWTLEKKPIPEPDRARIILEAKKLGKYQLRLALLNLMLDSIYHEGRISKSVISEARSLGEDEQGLQSEVKKIISDSYVKWINERGFISLSDLTTNFRSEQMVFNIISFALKSGLIDGYFTKDGKRFLTKEYIQNTLKSKLE